MKSPHNRKNDSCRKQLFHHHKANRHQYRYTDHNFNFCLSRHPSFPTKALQIVFIEFCFNKPSIKPFRTSCKAKHSQHKKWNRRQYWQNSPDNTKHQTQTSKNNICSFFNLHNFHFTLLHSLADSPIFHRIENIGYTHC